MLCRPSIVFKIKHLRIKASGVEFYHKSLLTYFDSSNLQIQLPHHKTPTMLRKCSLLSSCTFFLTLSCTTSHPKAHVGARDMRHLCQCSRRRHTHSKKKKKKKKNIEVWGLKLLQTQSTAAKTGLMLLFTKQMFAEYVKKKK